MRIRSNHFTSLLYGLSIWQGEAPHVGKTFGNSGAIYPIRAGDLDRRYKEFEGVDVWTMDGWLVTAFSLSHGITRCHVRKGKQVATLIGPDEQVFLHAAKHIHHKS